MSRRTAPQIESPGQRGVPPAGQAARGTASLRPRLPALAGLILLLGMAPGCGPDDGDPVPAGGAGICDLGSIASSLIGPEGRCPPKRVLIDTEAGKLHRFEQASWSDDQACTQFEIDGPACSRPCAPMSCAVEGDRVICDTRCSRELITCFILPESACAP